MILARNNINIWCQIDCKPGDMYKCGMGQEKKTPSILSLNLIPLGGPSRPSKGAFSQEALNK
jgi:hypothetical protein